MRAQPKRAPRSWASKLPDGISLVRVHPNVRRIAAEGSKGPTHRFLAWSVADEAEGRVVAHVPSLLLRDVRLIVHAGGRARVLRTGVKNVHAWAVGYYAGSAPQGDRPKGFRAVVYYPNQEQPAAFWFRSMGRAIESDRVFDAAWLDEEGHLFVRC